MSQISNSPLYKPIIGVNCIHSISIGMCIKSQFKVKVQLKNNVIKYYCSHCPSKT